MFEPFDSWAGADILLMVCGQSQDLLDHPLVGAADVMRVHRGSQLSPSRCWCGNTHGLPEGLADCAMTVLVEAASGTVVRESELVVTVGSGPRPTGDPHVHARPGDYHDVLSNLLGIFNAEFGCLSFDDLVHALRNAGEVGHVSESGNLAVAGQRVAAQLPAECTNGYVVFFLRPETKLREIDRALEPLGGRFVEDAEVLLCGSPRQEEGVSVLYCKSQNPPRP